AMNEIDIVDQLEVCADLYDATDPPSADAVIRLHRKAIAEIKRLRALAGPAPEPRQPQPQPTESRKDQSDRAFWDYVNAPPEPKPALPTFNAATMDDLDRRIAVLESSVRRTAHQIDAVREAMAACSRNDRLHASVRHIADTIALNLGAESPPPAPTFIGGERVVITHWDRHGVVLGRDEAGITVKCDDGEVVIVGDDSLLMEEEIADA
ncbi:MAG TPA: hypothetical protein VIK91_02620, partial [Nannocystis sp.]